MLIDVRGFWAHDNRENLLQEEEEQVEEAWVSPEANCQVILSHASQFQRSRKSQQTPLYQLL